VLVVDGDLVDAFGRHAAAAQHVGQERADIREALGAAERHDQYSVEHEGWRMDS
jgi:hypothetical protein